MIDHDKLKKADHLAEKLEKESGHPVMLHQDFILYHEDCGRLQFETIEELIEELERLVKPKPKYKVGQEVWAAYDDPKKFTIKDNYESKYHLIDANGDGWIGMVCESELYPTKKELICAQIQYWQSKMTDCILDDKEHINHPGTIKVNNCKCGALLSMDRNVCDYCIATAINTAKYTAVCDHESDGQVYKLGNTEISRVNCHKCIKCGEFYK